MATQGEQLLQAVRQVRDLCAEVSNLLLTVDAMMKDEGWVLPKGNACTYEGAYTILRPDAWLPYYLYRVYTNKDRPAALATACAVLEYTNPKLDEPLLVGSVFDYGHLKKEEWDGTWNPSYANWHMSIKGRTDNGETHTIDPRTEWGSDNDRCKAQTMRSFALPLVQFTDSAILKEQFVTRLLRLV